MRVFYWDLLERPHMLSVLKNRHFTPIEEGKAFVCCDGTRVWYTNKKPDGSEELNTYVFLGMLRISKFEPIKYTHFDTIRNKCGYHEYMRQFVTPLNIDIIKANFSVEELREAYAKDKHLNTIPLERWNHVRCQVSQAFLKLSGEGYMTKALNVAILKNAAYYIIENQ